MASKEANNRVDRLLDQTSELKAAGKLSEAAQRLKEAISLAPEDDRIISALNELQIQSPKIQRKGGSDEADGENNSPRRLDIISKRFSENATKTFKELWEHGDDGIERLIDAVLDAKVWASQDVRSKAEKDAFMLLNSSLLEPDQDNADRAMRAIARLLAVDAEKLQRLVEPENFNIMAASLDIRKDQGLRTQATLAIAKFLEVAEDRGRKLLIDFVMSRISRQDDESLSVAFSAAGALFPFVPKAAAELFLTEGFCDDLVRIGDNSKSSELRHSALELLSASCIDKSCREVVSKTCTIWLWSMVNNSESVKDKTLSALVISKISNELAQAPSTEQKDISSQLHKLVSLFKDIVAEDSPIDKHISIEGLAYQSMRPVVKEELARDSEFLGVLVKTLIDSQASAALIFGGFTIFSNLTTYQKPVSQDGERLAQLKAYANLSKPADSDPLNDDKHAAARCNEVLAAGVNKALLAWYRKSSPGVLALVASIALSISKTRENCGKMIQQGFFDLLLDLSNRETADRISLRTRLQSAQGLARILVPTNPNLIITSAKARAGPLAIRSLVWLMKHPEEDEHGHVNLVSTLQALMALTNLATLDGELGRMAQGEIWRTARDDIQDCIMNGSHWALQDAALGLITNLGDLPQARDYYADPAPTAAHRVRVLLALCESDNRKLALSAGGAVARHSATEGAVTHISKWEASPRIVSGMLAADDAEMEQRGCAVAYNIACFNPSSDVLGNTEVRILMQELKRKRGNNSMQGEYATEVLRLLDE